VQNGASRLVEKRQRAQLPENPTNITFSGQNGLIINGWAVPVERGGINRP
jgi:hypothetical protein